jgi:hypothetical protein
MQDSLLPSRGCATQDSLPPLEAAPATSSTGGSGCLSVHAAPSGRSTRGPDPVALPDPKNPATMTNDRVASLGFAP